MKPFIAPFDAFHDSTAPHSWLESLVKAHVGDGLAADFYREIAEWLDPITRDLVFEVLGDSGHSAFAVREVRKACQADPRLTGPLALWGRRLLGEAITQAQYVVADRDTLAELIVTGSGRSGRHRGAVPAAAAGPHRADEVARVWPEQRPAWRT